MKTAAAFLVALLVATSAHAISSYGKQVVDSINQRLDQFSRRDDFAGGSFAGKDDEARAHLSQAEDLLRDLSTDLRKLISDDRTPEVAAASKRVKQHEAYVAKLRSAMEGAGQTSKQLEQRNHDFVMEYGKHHNLVHVFLDLAKNPQSGAYVGDDPEHLRQILAALAEVHQGCTGKYAGIKNAGPFKNDQLRDAENWCKAAADRDALAKLAVKNLAQNTLKIVRDQIDRMRKDLERQEGFLRIDETMVRKALWHRDELAKELTTRYAKLFAAAGLTDAGDLVGPLDQTIAELNVEIDRLAPQWKFPAGGAHDGSEAMAKKQISAAFAGVKVVRSVMTDPQWKIVKNGLGIPLHRYKDGAVLYRVAGEKWCRHQAFTYSEKFDGRGYQKTDGVTVNYLRYLPCQ